MTSALRCSQSRLASGADSCTSTKNLSVDRLTVAPESITSVVRLRCRTFSRTVGPHAAYRGSIGLGCRTAVRARRAGSAAGGAGTVPGPAAESVPARRRAGTAGPRRVSRSAPAQAALAALPGLLGPADELLGRPRGGLLARGNRDLQPGLDALDALQQRGLGIAGRGSSSLAHTTSSSSRGAVAPRISPSPACTTSA